MVCTMILLAAYRSFCLCRILLIPLGPVFLSEESDASQECCCCSSKLVASPELSSFPAGLKPLVFRVLSHWRHWSSTLCKSSLLLLRITVCLTWVNTLDTDCFSSLILAVDELPLPREKKRWNNNNLSVAKEYSFGDYSYRQNRLFFKRKLTVSPVY